MKVAFYIADRGRLVDRLIADHDGGPFGHAELVFSDGNAFSSSIRDGGTRFKRIVFDPDKWRFVPLNINAQQESIVRAWCDQRKGLKYDLVGVLAFKLPWRRHDRGKWFCSEACTAALKRLGYFSGIRPERVSPNGLYRLLTET